MTPPRFRLWTKGRRPPWRTWRIWPWLLWAVYAPPLALLLLHARATVRHHWEVVTFPYQIDYGEAPELNRALLLARGAPIYVDWSHPPYQMANYTPLYPAAVSLAVRLTGPSFLPGRALSFAATLASAVAVALLVWALGAPGPGVAAGGLLWLASHPVWDWGAFQRVDALATLLELLGLTCVAVAWARRRRVWGVWLSVPLFVAAAYTRQTAVAGAFAAYGYLLFLRPRLALRATALYASLGLGLLALLMLVTSGQFWRHTVDGNLNRWSVDTLLLYVRPFWQLQRWPVVLGVIGLLFALLQRRAQLPALYALGAAATALTAGKIGAYVNYLLPAGAAVALGAGLAVASISRAAARWWPAAALHAAASFALTVGAWQLGAAAGVWPGTSLRAPYLSHVSQAQRRSAGLAHEHVARIPGDVLSEDMSFTVTTGRRLYLQPFEFTQLAEQGDWDQRPLLDDVRSMRFGVVVLRFDLSGDPSWHGERLNRPLLDAIREAYVPAAVYGDYFLYVPRPS
ncbi:MAG TPA: hypothetical protein VFX49_02470 [Chloroflexota bacterium]|nr:hypothetical protein [Chloroflexota bacterium]